MQSHCYIQRSTGLVVTERLFADNLINMIYSTAKEKPGFIYKAACSKGFTNFLGFINYDIVLPKSKINKIIKELNINKNECLEDIDTFRKLRQVFERKIKFYEFRPMPDEEDEIVSPADSRILIGSFNESSIVTIKNKFFDYNELLQKTKWCQKFSGGDFVICRLTPDKYHYNHVPVTGVVEDIYLIDGAYHSCNPNAVVKVVTPYSKNKRVVTIINTDIPGGTNIGMVAMIEIVAMMIGGIKQCYSDVSYEAPKILIRGMTLKKGQPKSLFRPGSSTTVLIFEKNKVKFHPDLIENIRRKDVPSRFSLGFGQTIVETEVAVRSGIAKRV